MAAPDNTVGLPADDDQSAPDSLLAKFDEYDVVDVFNPLSQPFRGKVARSVPINVPETARDRENRAIYGLDMRNPARQALDHVTQTIVIDAGKTKKLPGDVAKVIARQLVNTIMSLEGDKNRLADPTARREVEERVIVNSKKVYEEANTLSVEDRLEKQIDDLNKEEKVNESTQEAEFPSESKVGQSPVGQSTVKGSQAVPEVSTGATGSGSQPTAEKGQPTTGSRIAPKPA